jgi:hypothetical protein
MKSIKTRLPKGGTEPATRSALRENISARATEAVGALSAEQAYAVGTAVGSLLKDGMPIERPLSSTLTVAEFVRRGQAAQQAVDAILRDEQAKRKS